MDQGGFRLVHLARVAEFECPLARLDGDQLDRGDHDVFAGLLFHELLRPGEPGVDRARERLGGLRGHVRVRHTHARDLADLVLRRCRHLDLEQDELLLLAVELVEDGHHVLAGDVGLAAENADRTDAVGALDGDGDFLRADGEHVAELGLEYLREVGRGPREVVIPVALLCEPRHQVLVVVEAEADGRDRDAFLDERGAEVAELVGRTRSHVGEPVGDEDDPADEVLFEELADLGGALADAGEERGVAARREPVDAGLDGVLLRDLRGRDEHGDVVVVCDDRDDVLAAQTVDGHYGRLLGLGDLLATHRAGFVDDDRDVDGRPLLVLHPGETRQADLQEGRLLLVRE